MIKEVFSKIFYFIYWLSYLKKAGTQKKEICSTILIYSHNNQMEKKMSGNMAMRH